MARKRMVTRTIEQTTAKVMTLNVVTAEVTITPYTISGELTGDVLLKALQDTYQTDTMKLVHVLESTVESVLYGMEEEEFIKLAKVLPKRYVTVSESEDN
jgi:hypothetical protein